MTTLNNYLRGNLLLQKGFHNASFEANLKNFRFCQQLFSFSLQENINAKDRVVLIINFEIGKHKRFLYNGIASPDMKYENKKIVQLQPRLYLIEYSFDFDANNSHKEDKEAIYNLLVEFKQEVLKKSPSPLFLFVQGLEILELYIESHEIYYWLLKMLEEFNFLKQAYFFVQNDIMSAKLMEYLETLVNCRVLLEDYQIKEDKVEGIAQMVLAKNSGFSYFENYRVELKSGQKILCKIDKITKEMIEAQKNEGKDLQKIFQTPFKIELTEAEKKSKEQVILPHMKAQNAENVWKDYLLEVENEEEEADPEQDEDEDLDV